MKVIIPIKQHSERVLNKNFKQLGGVPLWRRAVDKFRVSFQVIVNTDSLSIIEELMDVENVITIERNMACRDSRASMNLIIKDTLNRCKFTLNEPIAQLHATSPFLTCNTVQKAMSVIIDDPSLDSVVGSNVLQARVWREHGMEGLKGVNHDPAILLPTQDLEPLYLENSAVYVFTPASFVRNGENRVGKTIKFIEIPFPENMDIDTPEDLRMCELMYKVLGENS